MMDITYFTEMIYAVYIIHKHV